MAQRAADIVLSAGALMLLSPFLLVVVVAVWLSSPGPIFFAGERIGRWGRPFRMYKFRTMVSGAEKLGASVTVGGDARITRVGRWLRRTKLDEVPSLLNVLVGQMSLVGPRPETGPWVARYTARQREVLRVRPGVTGMAQLKYRHEEELLRGKDLAEAYPPVMNDKLDLDLAYIENQSFLLYGKVLLQTVLAVLR